jgi:DNA-binding transcriptional regulator GbsR (MarR family)
LVFPKDQIRDPLDIFINGWGRMGVSWGMGKVMAEIQALLYLSPRPLSLDDMSERLKTSRSNISLNVRALQDLGVVQKVPMPGDRKDYYAAETELATVARRLAAAKKKRELDPALDVVTRTIQAANAALREDKGKGNGDPDGGGSTVDTERLQQLKDLMERIGDIFETFIDNKTTGEGVRDGEKTQNT